MSSKSKIYLTFILLIGSTCLIPTFLRAQRGPDHQRPPMLPDSTRIREMVTELDQAVTLTKEQKEKVTQLYTNHFAEMKKQREKSSGDWEAMRKSMEAARTKLDQDLKALLDTSQKEKYDKFIQERNARRHRPERRSPR